MTDAPLKAVLFDAVGTLLHPHPPVSQVYARAGQEHGSYLTEAQVVIRFNKAFKRQESRDSRGVTSEPRERSRWRTIVCEIFDHVPEPQEVFETLWAHFTSGSNWRLADDATDVLQAMEDRELTWGLASNFDSRLLKIVRDLRPLRSCQHVFVSSKLGWRKPHPQFFALIQQQLALEPQQLLLVGDHPDNDYHAARTAGWHAILLDPEGKHDVEHRIERLSDVIARLAVTS